MSSIIIQDIIKEYEDIQKKSKSDLEARKKMLFDKFPRLKQIEDDMIRLSVTITRSILLKTQDQEELLSSLQKKQLDLKIERAEILVTNNYPKDYLELRNQCKSCKDTGYINNKKCSCFIQKEIYRKYKQSNLSEHFKRENFDQFRLDYYSDEKDENGVSPRGNMKEIYLQCIKYSQNFDFHDKNLLFIGKPGLGKTFLCSSIAKDLLDKGKSVIYQSAPDFIDIVRKYKFDFEKEDSNNELLNDIFDCDLLIIDDLGTELTTQFANQVIYSIINKRIINNKKMVFSTNLDIDEIVKIYSDRITSRLFGNFSMYEFLGEDIRLKKRTM